MNLVTGLYSEFSRYRLSVFHLARLSSTLLIQAYQNNAKERLRVPIRLGPQQIENLQQLQATVSGPDGATRLFVITGILQAVVTATGSSPQSTRQTQTFTVLLGPVFSRRQFVQAVATATVARTFVQEFATQGTVTQLSWSIDGVDADWDDESGQVELRIEVSAAASGNNTNASVQGLTFQVTILAALDQ